MHFVLFLLLFSHGLLSAYHDETHQIEPPILPGRLGSKHIYYTELGKARVFFYMTPEKDQLARSLIQSINNNNLMISTDVTSLPCPVSEVSLVVTKSDAANFDLQGVLSRDDQNRPIYTDPVGQEIMNNYGKRVMAIAEQQFGVKIEGLSRDISLNVNQDALKMHQDRFTKQYDYLHSLPLPIPKYVLVQDLTLADWHMAASSFSATMVQDGPAGDRFLMALFPGQVFGALYTEAMVYKGPNVSPEYPGPITFPPHTAVAPIDYLGCCNVGSWKGKRISTSTRGVVLETEMERAREKAVYLPINRPKISEYRNGLKSYDYANGIVVRELVDELPEIAVKWLQKLPDQENISIYEGSASEQNAFAEELMEVFGFKGSLKRVLHLTKKGGGFSQFKNIVSDLPASAEVIIVNHSKFPPGYKHYPISEDCTKQQLPWIQMYQFPENTVMKVPGSLLQQMALTPVEEILYRNERSDAVDGEESVVLDKLVSKIDLFLFSEGR